MDDRRYYGLDALRGAMMMLGIVLHAAMFYLVAPPMPVPVDHNTAYIFDVTFYFIHSFRMQAFFLLAGFFTGLLVTKRGAVATYKDRAKRILLPLLLGCVTVLPIAGLFMADFALSVRFGTHQFIPDIEALKIVGRELVTQGLPIDQPSLGHLWFLEYLCMFYLLIPLCRALVNLSLPYETSIKQVLASPYTLLVFGLCSAAILWPFHGGVLVLENTALLPHLPSLIYFGWFFVLGFIMHHYRDFLPTLARNFIIWVVLSALSFPLARFATSLDVDAQGNDAALHFFAVIANGLCTWSLIYLFLGGALRYFDRESVWIQYISQSAYWVFLVHLPLVAFGGWWLVQFDMSAVAKFLINCSFTTIVAMLTFHYCVQRTWISDFLHGRKFDLQWPWQARKAT